MGGAAAAIPSAAANPPPLDVFYPMVGPFGVGFVLSPTGGTTSLGSLEKWQAIDSYRMGRLPARLG